ncbi:MAG: radical SAM protein, partial [Lachnospiraceae bacterium]|nr:radical SAM protein [Lachnospiraceae bacterium]
MKHLVARVEPASIAEEMEIEAGDCVLSVNGEEIEDVFDWRALTGEEELYLLIEKKNGEEWELEIEKDADEDLGIVFASDLMSDYRRCSNGCIFCFIDQMPPGMRETLYFKDDDSRLSFLQGNYITLTNMKERDVERIIRYRMEPMNISVHTTEPELRCMMLRSRFAGSCLR